MSSIKDFIINDINNNHIFLFKANNKDMKSVIAQNNYLLNFVYRCDPLDLQIDIVKFFIYSFIWSLNINNKIVFKFLDNQLGNALN